MILCKMVTKPFKIGPFGMPLRRFFIFFVVFVLKELVPGAKDQDSAVLLMFLMFLMYFFYVFLGFQQKSAWGAPPPDQNDRLT